MNRPLIFERSTAGRTGHLIESFEGKSELKIPENLLRTESANLPEVSETEVIRHYTELSTLNYGVDSGFYPLGSCTMKYNPKVNEDLAGLADFSELHPYQPVETVQGTLELMHNLSSQLAKITGMDAVTLQPAAGAHGELTGIMMIRAYHESRGDFGRTKIIVPDSAHGTNPATARVAGLDIIEVKSNAHGEVDIESLKAVLDESIAGLMLTNPNTLGLFETQIEEIASLVHKAGGLLYYDGANMNAIMGQTRPGDMGFDVVHLNLHKTFSTPHGGGGPGSGPVGVKDKLTAFLPKPLVVKNEEGGFDLDYNRPESIGRVKSYYGNIGIAIRAYAYIKAMGADGIKAASETAVLNANYMQARLKEHYKLPLDRICKHEFVLAGTGDALSQVTTLDIAKRLLDYGYHPPTIYFPLIVDSALMIEPTETESMETIDRFVEAMVKIREEIRTQPDLLKSAPVNTVIGRVDETLAARKPVLRWRKGEA
jgi:glycine dehydrogenase subunit 2